MHVWFYVNKWLDHFHFSVFGKEQMQKFCVLPAHTGSKILLYWRISLLLGLIELHKNTEECKKQPEKHFIPILKYNY